MCARFSSNMRRLVSLVPPSAGKNITCAWNLTTWQMITNHSNTAVFRRDVQNTYIGTHTHTYIYIYRGILPIGTHTYFYIFVNRLFPMVTAGLILHWTWCSPGRLADAYGTARFARTLQLGSWAIGSIGTWSRWPTPGWTLDLRCCTYGYEGYWYGLHSIRTPRAW